jgi:hypothetical protein
MQVRDSPDVTASPATCAFYADVIVVVVQDADDSKTLNEAREAMVSLPSGRPLPSTSN